MSAYYNENDPFAAAWLRELIKAGLIADGDVDERSIAEVKADDVRGYTQAHWFAGIGGWSYALRLAGWPDDREVWTGSCPCQPWSVAGSGTGANDPRHLWPAWSGLIEVCRPPVVFGEQVASEDGRFWLDLVFADMETRDYAIAAFDLPACSIGAPHKRSRLWFVADTNGERISHNRQSEAAGAAADRCGEARQQWIRPDAEPGRCDCGHGHDDHWGGTEDCMSCSCTAFIGALDDSERNRAERIAGREGCQESAPSGAREPQGSRRLQALNAGDAGVLGDTNSARLALRSIAEVGRGAIRHEGAAIGAAGATRGFWERCEWIGHEDGVYRPVEPESFPLAPRLPGDVEQIHAYGNAIVPQVAAAFIEAYCDARGIK